MGVHDCKCVDNVLQARLSCPIVGVDVIEVAEKNRAKRHECPTTKVEKVAIVITADAIVREHAMVVHVVDAAIAPAAVVDPIVPAYALTFIAG